MGLADHENSGTAIPTKPGSQTFGAKQSEKQAPRAHLP